MARARSTFRQKKEVSTVNSVKVQYVKLSQKGSHYAPSSHEYYPAPGSRSEYGISSIHLIMMVPVAAAQIRPSCVRIMREWYCVVIHESWIYFSGILINSAEIKRRHGNTPDVSR